MNKFEKIEDLKKKGFLCEVVTDGWANWQFDEEGKPLRSTATPLHYQEDANPVGYRGCYYFFNEQGALIWDDVGMYNTFEKALDALFKAYEEMKGIIDHQGFNIIEQHEDH